MRTFAIALSFAGAHSTTPFDIALASTCPRHVAAAAVATIIGEVATAAVVAATIGELALASTVAATLGKVALTAFLADCAVLSAGSARFSIWTEGIRVCRGVRVDDYGFITHVAFAIGCIGRSQ